MVTRSHWPKALPLWSLKLPKYGRMVASQGRKKMTSKLMKRNHDYLLTLLWHEFYNTFVKFQKTNSEICSQYDTFHERKVRDYKVCILMG